MLTVCSMSNRNSPKSQHFKDIFIPETKVEKQSYLNLAPTLLSTAKLEQKIESLVSLLASAQGVNLNRLTPPESNSHSEAQHSPVAQTPCEVLKHAKPDASLWGAFPGQDAIAAFGRGEPPPPRRLGEFPGTAVLPVDNSTVAPPKQHFSSSIWILSDQDGDQLVDKFREHFTPHFPFVVIPSKSISELRTRHPYVLKAIWTVAFQQSRAHQIEMCKDLMVDISTSMLIRGEKDLDMLQGVILLNAWSYFVSPVPPALISTGLFQLAIALLFDLKLTRPIREYDGPGEMLAECQTRNIPDSLANDTARRNSDECRALLCCYYLGSVYSLCVKRTEGLSYTPYIDFCCQTLEERVEHESDLLLVASVRLEHLIHPIDNLLTKKSFTDDHRAPVAMHIKAVRDNMESFWRSLPPSIQQNRMMTMSYASNSVFLYEPSFYKALFPTTSFAYDSSQRLDLLHSCMVACKKLLDEYLERPMSAYYGTSVADLAPLGRGISSLLKLCVLEEPGWDLGTVRQTANLNYYFEQLLEKFSQVGADIDRIQRQPCRHSFLTGCARAMGVVKTWYETKVGSDSTPNYQAASVLYDGIMNGEDVNFLDDSYWMEFMGDWPMQQ